MATPRTGGGARPTVVSAAVRLAVVLLVVLTLPVVLDANEGRAAPSGEVHLATASPAIGLPTAVPRAFGGPRSAVPENVDPNSLYSSEPAPMGIADFGVTPGGVAYSYSTSTFLGTAAIGSLSTYNSSLSGYDSDATIQFNVILTFDSGRNAFAYWVQDVLYITTSSNTVSFDDNIWNMTNGNSAGMLSSTVSGNGSVSSYDSVGYYYDGASLGSGAGNGINLHYPATVELKVVSEVSSGTPRVYFDFEDGHGWQTFDTAKFKFTDAVKTADFTVQGSNYQDNYLFDDAELILGGPGNGYDTSVTGANVSFSIEYDNGHNLQEVPAAYDFGSDTAEAVNDSLLALATTTSTGALASHMTKGSGKLLNLYDPTKIALFNATTALSSGSIAINGTTIGPFRANGFNLTLAPGQYNISILVNGSWREGGLFELSAGEYLFHAFNPPEEYNVTFTENGLPAGTLWSVSVDSTRSASTTSSIVVELPNGTYRYAVGAVPGYLADPTSGGFSVAGSSFGVSPVNWTVRLYLLTITERGLPSGTPWTISLNGTAYTPGGSSFTVQLANGSYSYHVPGVPGYLPSNPNGLVGIDGFPGWLNVTFALGTFLLSFAESGLPSGTLWILSFGGFNYTARAGAQLSFHLPNGTYYYSIATGAPYLSADASGSVSIEGAPETKTVAYVAAGGTLFGTVDPGNATVLINGTLVSVSSGSFRLELPPGNYSIIVSAPGYYTFTTNVTVGPGGATNSSVTLEPVPTHVRSTAPPPSDNIGPFTPLGLLVVLSVAALTVLAAAYGAGRRRRVRRRR